MSVTDEIFPHIFPGNSKCGSSFSCSPQFCFYIIRILSVIPIIKCKIETSKPDKCFPIKQPRNKFLKINYLDISLRVKQNFITCLTSIENGYHILYVGVLFLLFLIFPLVFFVVCVCVCAFNQ